MKRILAIVAPFALAIGLGACSSASGGQSTVPAVSAAAPAAGTVCIVAKDAAFQAPNGTATAGSAFDVDFVNQDGSSTTWSSSTPAGRGSSPATWSRAARPRTTSCPSARARITSGALFTRTWTIRSPSSELTDPDDGLSSDAGAVLRGWRAGRYPRHHAAEPCVAAGGIARTRRPSPTCPASSRLLPFSKVVEAGGLVFLAGQAGDAPGAHGRVLGGIEVETRAALDNVGRLLHAVRLDHPYAARRRSTSSIPTISRPWSPSIGSIPDLAADSGDRRGDPPGGRSPDRDEVVAPAELATGRLAPPGTNRRRGMARRGVRQAEHEGGGPVEDVQRTCWKGEPG